MYIPKAFEETRHSVLHALMHAEPFCSLITVGASGLVASHLPMVLEEQGSSPGLLTGHLSRANPQWREFTPEVETLVIFAGPHHYISPTWYPETATTGKTVPTWNYIVVHAYGYLKIVEDPEWLRAHLERLISIHEQPLTSPWKITDSRPEYIASLAKGIVGLELPIDRLEGKWKLNQNRSEEDRRGVIEGLVSLNTPQSREMEKLVRQTL